MLTENNYEPANNIFRKIYTIMYNFFGIVEMF